MARWSVGFGALGSLGACMVALGCGVAPPDESSQTTSRTADAVTGSNSQTWTTGASPWGGVAQLLIKWTACGFQCADGLPPSRGWCAGGTQPTVVCAAQMPAACSGTLIARDLVLTAGHCVCDLHAPPIATIDDIQVNFPAMPVGATTGWQQVDWTTDDCNGADEDDASKDLAMIRLPGNVSETIVNSQLLKPTSEAI